MGVSQDVFVIVIRLHQSTRSHTALYIKFACLFADVSKLHIIHEGQPNLIPFSLSEAQSQHAKHIFV